MGQSGTSEDWRNVPICSSVDEPHYGVILTEGGGGEAGYGAGHEEVCDLLQGEQSCGVVPLVHLFLDQSL